MKGVVKRVPPEGRLGGHGALLRQTSVLAAATALSRVTGFIRTSVWAAALGLYTVGSAFAVANTLPTTLYTLIAGGALSAVFVPQLVRAIGQGKQTGAAFADRLLTLTVLVLAPLTTLAVLVAPALARLYTGAGWPAADIALASAFTAWCLPQIFFYGVFAVLSQVLHAHDKPAPMMWAPVANNAIAIAVGIAFIAYGSVDAGPGLGASGSVSSAEVAFLGGGATLGVAVQTLILIPVLRASGFRYRPRLDLRGSGLGRSARLAGWSVLFVVVNEVAFSLTAVVVNTAGKAAEASATWAAGLPSYTNTYMIMLVPHAVVTVSIATTLLPSMSRSAVEGRHSEVGAAVGRSLLLAGPVLVPAAAALVAVGPLLTRLVFPGNPASDTWYMGMVLVGFAPAVVVFSAQFLVVRGMHALENTRTPAMIQLLITSVQVVTAAGSGALLPPEWVVVGVACGFSAAYAIGLTVSLTALRRATGGPSTGTVARGYLRWVLAAVPAAAIANVAATVVVDQWGTGIVSSGGALAAAAVAFTAVYAGAVRVIPRGANEHRPMGRAVAREDGR